MPSLAAALAQWAPRSEATALEDWIHILTAIPATRISITPDSDFAPSQRKVAQFNLIHGGLEMRSSYLHTLDCEQGFIYFDSSCAKAISGAGTATTLLRKGEAQAALECLSYRGGKLSPRLLCGLMDLEQQAHDLRRLLEVTNRSSLLYKAHIGFDERINAVLRGLLSEGLPERLWNSEIASLQLLFAQCWELQSLAYFLSCCAGPTNTGPCAAWHALLKKHLATSCVIDLNSGPVRFCAWYLQPYVQHGGAIGTRAMLKGTMPPKPELAVFECDGIRTLQCEATKLGMLQGPPVKIRFGYFKAMVCERRLRPKSAECRFLSKAAVLGSFDNEGTDKLIAEEYLRRSTGWPICSF